MSVSRDELALNIGEAQWVWLKNQAKPEAWIWVSPKLDLVDVGLAMIADEKLQIESLLTSQLLKKPTTDFYHDWEADVSTKFKYLVIQPFVLIQPYSDRSPVLIN